MSDVLAVSAAQSGMWFGHQLDPANPAYNTGYVITIHGPVDVEIFRESVARLIDESEGLRATFGVDGEQLRQRIEDMPAELPFREIDADEAERWIAEDMAKPVDLATGPLFNHALFQTGAEEYRWYFRVHHIATDGFGWTILLRRAAQIYSALVAGADSAVPPLDSLAPVIADDARYHDSAARESDRDYWIGRLSGVDEPATLTGRTAPVAYQCRRLVAEIPLSTVAGLRGIAWPTAVIAAAAGYLHQQTGEREILLGLPVMGRLGTPAMRVPTVAMNIVAVRLSIRPQETWTTLMRQVADDLAEGRSHHRYRHEQLRRDRRLIGGQQRLFGPVINPMPFGIDLRFGESAASVRNLSAGPVEDLSILVRESADGAGMRLELDAHPELYSDDDLVRHRDGFFDCLASLVRDPESAIEVEDRHGVLSGGLLPGPAPDVLAVIREVARLRPSSVAIEDGSVRLTYADLLDRADTVARALAARGAGPEDIVVVAVPRGSDAIVAFLAVLMTGAAYLPLDPGASGERVTSIVVETRPISMVTLESDAQWMPLATQPRVFVDRPGDHAPVPAGDVSGDQLTYVIYTSGSTGAPKGVMVSRGALSRWIPAATACYGIGGLDRVLQFAPLHFDASVEEIYLTLCAGATLVVRPEGIIGSVKEFLRFCADRAITVLDLPTAYWHELVYALSIEDTEVPHCIRTVIIGGEAASPERMDRWREAAPDTVRLFNTYGPTEATVVATAALVS